MDPKNNNKNFCGKTDNLSNESNVSYFLSSASYQQFASNINEQITRSSTFITSKLSLGLIIEKFKFKNRKIYDATENVRISYMERKKKFDKILRMYERQQERSKRNLELYRERQTLCFEEMKRLEEIIRKLRGRLNEIVDDESEEEVDYQETIGVEE